MSEQRSSTGRIRGTGRRRRKPSRGRRTRNVALWAGAAVVVVGGSGLGYAYLTLNGNIEAVDIDAALGADRPDDVDDGSQDILVLGSDSRSGANSAYGADEGAARSDTAMVVHVDKGHTSADVVSVPRDTLVDRPACTSDTTGREVGAESKAMFNTAYEVGGPACAVKTVEAMSGIRMDHYVEVDFTGFKKIVDELGGVRITTAQAIDDSHSHLRLDPGTHTLTGEQSLGLVRTRKSVGDGSDLGRIQLQQAFVKALMAQAKGVGVFSSPKTLFGLADTATKAVTTDSGLASVKKLTGFANGLKGLGPKNVDMVTLPVEYDPADPNRVLPQEEAGRQLWAALAHDRPIPASATARSAGDKGDASEVVR
ncbi:MULTISPECIES: LCP family protein [unclassified Streptomyces]|uniref:LCP family protein n=1 Tax=unclassified Streptomyces TaxID=2593676 RepID=UPI0001C1CA40|nr:MULTISPECIES: LCP family protein [unclassified Streptomyces]AEN12381.1 cell envelope-related transcriptional attenuator [Streptomyces sp. SirexAA-E]MYR69771.1 LytR family transcriptional regulator [Streptomyces sp. SID4939]MYR99932.1 LytR family transcriptional regulator [Streptomyces sp. SID4940]MYT63079.1 LytR family transcriptional regulator [Streptomyces sp. SID8357]MYT88645.1 LytR family transcriptional regulator [Streptomyces sp. SID8360]